ncbi:O-methyltransferase B [Fusarium heterosporum]|uniref:O-methyltransferase B n=1 Tax=Fusarium heterosporum TaxID=42747 RepID=A0A8H5WVD5_FUSHE|nr:O-methyltransferase B [Fusarium heterosporum]
MSRCQTLEKATSPLIASKQEFNYRGLKVSLNLDALVQMATKLLFILQALKIAELVTIRTFMEPKVLYAILASGFIFLQDLPESTNVQDSFSNVRALKIDLYSLCQSNVQQDIRNLNEHLLFKAKHEEP